MTIKKVSELTNISVRTLQYYSDEGLVCPERDDTGTYGNRVYDEGDLKRLQQVIIFKSLGMKLKEIKQILTSPDYDPVTVFQEQIHMLKEKRKYIDNLINYVELAMVGGTDFFSLQEMRDHDLISLYSNFDNISGNEKVMNVGSLDAASTERMLNAMDVIFRRFGELKKYDVGNPKVQENVDLFIQFLSEYSTGFTPVTFDAHYRFLTGNGNASRVVDEIGGPGTGRFAADALKYRLIKNLKDLNMWVLKLFTPLEGKALQEPDVRLAYEQFMKRLQEFFRRTPEQYEETINDYKQFATVLCNDQLKDTGIPTTMQYVLMVADYYSSL